ncbi:S9 family peptidase [Phenylobacterium sp.]|uniref:alpha/beta hydrolase family protein n=1 Tax=Phenylobacterium sp. TaxID=1871053 RepID=UPI002B78ADB8|nr:S9 family peptidase [Phenylobacterium sp.]HVI32788.1 S9 family peptidase [Phenylobacterium sp.]
MIRLLSALASLAFLLAAPAAAAPLEAYGKLPAIEDAAISPSGHAVALIATDGEQRVIAVREVATGEFLMKAGAGPAKVRAVQWAGDRNVLIVTSATAAPMGILGGRREWMLAYAYDLQTQKARPLLRDNEYGMNTIFDMPVVRTYRGEPAVFVQGVKFSDGRGNLSLFRITLERATSHLVEQGGKDTRDWIVGIDGQPVAQELYDRSSGRWSLKIRNGPGWREVQQTVAPLDEPYVVGLGRSGEHLLFASYDDGRTVWQEIDLKTGAPGRAMKVLEAERALRDPQDGRLIGRGGLVGDEDRWVFFDPEDAKVWRTVLSSFPDSRVSLRSWSADRKKIIVLVDSPTEGPAYAVVDLTARKATWLGGVYQGLKPADIARKESIRFKAADGLELTGYLTLPRGREAKALPLVVLPHGGPASRDDPGFDWWPQAIASRGYAVLQVNFRGSDGLGNALLEAGYGQWGRKMQTDLSDGVRHLAGQGIIDPKRVCIVGASYGGYAALAGATHDRGVYRCAASFGGVSDLRRQIGYSRSRSGEATLRYWTRFVGAEDLGDPVMAELSPAAQAHRAEIPILLVHGKDDTVVPLEQSRLMADALRKAGKPHELVVQPGEDHWLTRGATRLQMLEAVVAFLEKHNPPT